jgi:hypothetical protein
MPSISLKDNEQAKFRDATLGRTKVAVDLEQTSAIPVTGEFNYSGLRVRLKITNTTVTDVVSAIPLVALDNRNSIIIENRSSTDSFFIGEITVTSSGINQGWEITPSSIFSTDITNDIVLYVIADTGKSVDVKIMELA